MSEREATVSDRDAANGRKTLSARLTVDEAIAVILTQGQLELVTALRAALDRPMPETVHGLRVALRRLRAGLALCARWSGTDGFGTVKRDVHALSDALGETRNWDIFITETLARHVVNLAGVADVAALTEAAATARHAGYRRVRALLDGPLPQKLLLGLALLISERRWRRESNPIAKRLAVGVRSRAEREIARADRKLGRQGKQLHTLSEEGRHALRIEIKHLGYTVDFLQPIWKPSRKITRYRDRLKALQTGLGSLTDAGTAQQLLNRIAMDDPSPAVQKAVGAIGGWAARDKIERLASLEQLWRDFRKTKRFW